MQWVFVHPVIEALAGVASFWVDAPGLSFAPDLSAEPEPPAEPPAAPGPPEPTRKRSRSLARRNKPARKGKCGACVYCKRFGPLTKEHLLPKSAGGTLTVKACRACNQARGNLGDFPPFLGLIRRRRRLWIEHVAASTNPHKTRRWLRAYGLSEPG
jgi:hypothetical protein